MGKGNAKGNKRAPKYGRRATKRQTFFYQQLLLLRSLFPEIKNPSRNEWIFASVNNHVPRYHSAWAEWKLDACQEWVWQEEKEKNRDVIFYLSRIKEQSERESEDDILTQSLPNPNFRPKKYRCLAEDSPTSHTCFPCVDTLNASGAATIGRLLEIIGLFCKRAV